MTEMLKKMAWLSESDRDEMIVIYIVGTSNHGEDNTVCDVNL